MAFVICALGLTIGSHKIAYAGQSATPSLAPMLSRIIPPVVSISVRGKSNGEQDDTLYLTPGGQDKSSSVETAPGQISETAGIGAMVDARNGCILTNNHVIATSIKVTIANGETYEAVALGTDVQTDLAAIRIPAG